MTCLAQRLTRELSVSQSASRASSRTLSISCLNLLEPTWFAEGRRELSVSQSQVRGVVEELSVLGSVLCRVQPSTYRSPSACSSVSRYHLQKLRGLLCVGLNVLCISPNWEIPGLFEMMVMGRILWYWFKDHGIMQQLVSGEGLCGRGGGSTEWTDTSQLWKHEHDLHIRQCMG